MSTLTDILPQLAQVKVGDTSYIVGQFQIRDLSQLQALLERRFPHPYEVHRRAILDGDEELREALILRVRKEQSEWPPMFGPETVMDFETLNIWLYLLLSKHNDLAVAPTYFPTTTAGLTVPEAVTRIALTITSEELAALEKVAYNDTPRDRFARLLRSDRPDNSSFSDSWGEKVDLIAVTHHLTYAQVGEMTISQFWMARSGGKAEEMPTPSLAGLTHEQIIERLVKERRLLKMGV